MGGALAVQSVPGQGTSATVYLPIPEAPVRAEPEPVTKVRSTPGSASGGLRPRRATRVLLADDHKILRDGLASLLRRESDIEVVGEAGDGQQAIELAQRLEPDVVLMDVNMPRLNGVEATRRLKAQMPWIRVIGLSMLASDEMGPTMRAAGAEAYLSKEGASDTLCKAIRDLAGVGPSQP